MNYNDRKARVALYLPLGKKHEPWGGIGGAEKRLCYLLSHIDKNKYETFIVFRVHQDHSQVKKILDMFISHHCQTVFVNNDREAFFHFFKAKYNCVFYDDYMIAAKAGILGACLAGSKRVLIFVTEYYARWDFNQKWHALLMRHNVAMAHRLDCLYPSSKDLLQNKFPNKPVSITPCSLPFCDIFIDECAKTKKEKLIVFAGRLVEGKNPMLLLDAIDIIFDRIVEANFNIWICGKGPLENNVIQRIQSRNYGKHVCYMGVENMHRVLPKAKVFCSLQNNENYPSQSLLEAIASGCLCIATNVGSTRTIVKNSFGILIDKSPKCLADALQISMSKTDSEYEKIKGCAKNFALEQFNANRAIRHYEILCDYAICD